MVKLPRRRASIVLPVMPRRFARGDKRNYLRWHCWIEGVRALAAHYRNAPAPRKRRR